MAEEKKLNRPAISLFSSKPKQEKKSDSGSTRRSQFNPNPFSTRPSPFGPSQYTSTEEEKEVDEENGGKKDE